MPPKSRPSHQIWAKIAPGWDHDLHLHSNWSQDNLTGPAIRDYIPWAEKHKIHIGFTEHFEFLHYEVKNPKMGIWKLTPDTVDRYLEEIDQAKAEFPHLTSGLEFDFYPSRVRTLQDFMDRYRKQFDFYIGSLHELEDFHPVTLYEDFQWLIQKYGGFTPVASKYFDMVLEMANTGIFDAIAHPDVIYRFFSESERQQHPEYGNDPRVLEIGRVCAKCNMLLEVNLSGLRYKWGRTFPEEAYVTHLQADGVEFFVGSDSHSVDQFRQSVLAIRRFNSLLKEHRVC